MERTQRKKFQPVEMTTATPPVELKNYFNPLRFLNPQLTDSCKHNACHSVQTVERLQPTSKHITVSSKSVKFLRLSTHREPQPTEFNGVNREQKETEKSCAVKACTKH